MDLLKNDLSANNENIKIFWNLYKNEFMDNK